MPSTAMPWGAFHFLIVAISELHPTTKILLWLGLAIAIQGLGAVPLMLLSVVAAALLLTGLCSLLMVRRARWLLLSLVLIYAFATPGDAMIPLLGALSPSLQGLQGGAMQAWRLILLLLSLGLLLQSCPRNSLLSGLYVLMRPFGSVGINADRIAVRLWLTLRYAEQQPRRSIQSWWNELRSTLDPVHDAVSVIDLELPAFTWRDALALTLAVFLLGLALW